MAEKQNSAKPKKDDKAVIRPSLNANRIDKSGHEEMINDKKTAAVGKGVKKAAIALENINRISDTDDYVIWQKRKRAKSGINDDGLKRLHSEYPVIALAIQKYRGFKEENPIPNAENTKEKPRRKNEKLSVRTKKPFENNTGNKESLNNGVLAVTISMKSIAELFIGANGFDKLGAGDAGKAVRVGRHLSGLNKSLSEILEYYEKNKTQEDEAYKKEILKLKEIIGGALSISREICERRRVNGEESKKRANHEKAVELLYNLRSVEAFFVSERNKKPQDIQTRKGVSTAVTGKKSEKANTLNMSRAKITEAILNQFGDIIQSEDEYEKRLENSEYGENKPGVESIRAKYEALHKFFEAFGIRPEHLVTQDITGRKVQMTILTKYIAF